MILDEVNVRSSPRGGTLIGDAVREASKSFLDKEKGHKAIIVFTDGGDQESFPVEAAKEAFTEKGIKVFTVDSATSRKGPACRRKRTTTGYSCSTAGRRSGRR